MRTIFLRFSTIVVMVVVAGNVNAKPPTIVYPTGLFPTDVQNVQAAINQGGTVLLKATDSVGEPLAFNFGAAAPVTGSGVNIVNDVSVTGELVGTVRTTIRGGDRPIIIFGGRNSVSSLKFDGPFKGPILVLGSAGTSIVGNDIENVVPATIKASGFTFTESDGIDVFSPNVTGNIVISANTIGDLTGNFAFGVQIDAATANVTISNNNFQLGQSVSDNGFVNSGAIACVRCHSLVSISGNSITLGPGIVVAAISIAGGPDARYHVFGNMINSQGPLADGIDAVGITDDTGVTDQAVIERNIINLLNTDVELGSGVGLLGTVTNSLIQNNSITGNAPAALFAFGSFAPGQQVSNNRFMNNDIASVYASVATIFFDEQSVNNIVRGQCVDVIDLGIGNNISCPNSHSNVNSGALIARQQMLQRALQAQSALHAQSSNVGRP